MVQVSKRARFFHRSRMDIMANILQAAEESTKKTRIMYQCNLSFRQLRVYLDFLIDMGFLEAITLKTEDNCDSLLFRITSKGKAFIKAYLNLRTLLVACLSLFAISMIFSAGFPNSNLLVAPTHLTSSTALDIIRSPTF